MIGWLPLPHHLSAALSSRLLCFSLRVAIPVLDEEWQRYDHFICSYHLFYSLTFDHNHLFGLNGKLENKMESSTAQVGCVSITDFFILTRFGHLTEKNYLMRDVVSDWPTVQRSVAQLEFNSSVDSYRIFPLGFNLTAQDPIFTWRYMSK